MKVLHINYSDEGGGAEQFSYHLHLSTPGSKYLSHYSLMRNNSYVLPENSYTRLISVINVFIRKISRFRSINHLSGYLDSGHFFYSRLKRMPVYRECDIVHLHNVHGGWFDLGAIAKIDKEKSIVWTLHDMWSFTGGEAYTFDNENYKIGNAITPFAGNYPLRDPLFEKRPYYLKKKKEIYKTLQNTVFVPVSAWLEACFRSSFVYHPQLQLHLIKNGIDLSVYNMEKRRDSIKPRVLYFNSASPFKGAGMARATLKEYGEACEIFVIGKKPETINNYQWLGERISDRNELSSVYQSVDILLFPSLAENMPLTVLEAMACGVCVIANPVGGIPEIIRDGETGYLASELDQDKFSFALGKALASDYREVGQKANSFVAENHSWTAMVEEYKKLYELSKG